MATPGCSIGRGKRRPSIELRNPHYRVPIVSSQGEGNIVSTALGKLDDERGWCAPCAEELAEITSQADVL